MYQHGADEHHARDNGRNGDWDGHGPSIGCDGCVGFEYDYDQRHADGVGDVYLQHPLDGRLRERECDWHNNGK